MTTRMPWGRHQGEPIADVPSGYLVWVIENGGSLKPHLATAIRDELARRFARPCQACACRQPETPSHAITAELVSRWSRQLAMQFHPDRGGSDQAMAAINRARETLLAMITEGGGQ